MNDDLHHGGALDHVQAAFPDAPLPWLDLSTGINPWPWPVSAQTLNAAARLPDTTLVARCREAMASAFGCRGDALLPVPGTALAISALTRLIDARSVAVLNPGYADHERYWRRSGAKILLTEDILAAAQHADVVVLSNPNNPDGRRFAPDALMPVCEQLAARKGWLVVDEAYAELTPTNSIAAHAGQDGLVVLRSLGKFYGLPGLRLGAVAGPSKLLNRLRRWLGDWPVSSIALEVGARAYGDLAWRDATRRQLSQARLELDALLSRAELTPVGGTDLFRYVQVRDAHARWTALARRGIYVRRFAQAPEHLRIGLPASPDALRARLNL
ncbi:MAG: threonine-phosphate decarboxylase CobD [Pseudomonadota bacterium]